MIDLYYWTTPNGHKITIFLEETGLPYKIFPINIGKGEQFQPHFLKVSPNNRIPAIVDHEPMGGGAPISVFETGAILFYLGEKTGQFLPTEPHKRYDVDAVAVLADGRARADGRAEQPFPQLRGREAAVRDQALRGRDQPALWRDEQAARGPAEFLAGDYSIADMASYPWIVPWERQGQKLVRLPASQALVRDHRSASGGQARLCEGEGDQSESGGIRTPEERAILFGQTAAVVR